VIGPEPFEFFGKSPKRWNTATLQGELRKFTDDGEEHWRAK
jgi:hypothetical protein